MTTTSYVTILYKYSLYIYVKHGFRGASKKQEITIVVDGRWEPG